MPCLTIEFLAGTSGYWRRWTTPTWAFTLQNARYEAWWNFNFVSCAVMNIFSRRSSDKHVKSTVKTDLATSSVLNSLKPFERLNENYLQARKKLGYRTSCKKTEGETCSKAKLWFAFMMTREASWTREAFAIRIWDWINVRPCLMFVSMLLRLQHYSCRRQFFLQHRHERKAGSE